MGVVHKLRKEVFDFIINQKKEDPSLSCRQISDLISSKFEIKVSKSSVNSVLKSTQLSSSVGRRVLKKAMSKKFQIPQQKKQQLLESISTLGFTFDHKATAEEDPLGAIKDNVFAEKQQEEGFSLEKLSLELQEHDRKKRKSRIFYNATNQEVEDIAAAQMTQGVQGENKEASANKEKKAYIVPAGPIFFDEEQFLYDLKIAREDKEKEKNNRHLYDNAGVVFLKAAQIDTDGENLLGDLFRKNSKGVVVDNFNNICSGLLFLKAFNIQSVENIEKSKNDALWRLNGFRKGYPGRENLFGWTQKIDFSNQLQLEYLNEKEQSLSSIKAFRIIFEDATSIILDAQMRSIWREPVQQDLFSSLSSAMTLLSKKLISNNECLVMDVLREKGINRTDFARILASFFDIIGRKMRKIEVLSEKQEILAEFTLIPSIKRFFIVGFRPYQEIFKEYICSITDTVEFPYYDRPRDRVLYYSEVNVPLVALLKDFVSIPQILQEERPLKWVLLGQQKKKASQIALLTNMTTEKAESIISKYLTRWPSAFNKQYIEEGDRTDINREELNKNQKEYQCYAGDFVEKVFDNFGDIFNDYILTLHKYCLDKYFPKQKSEIDIKTMVSIFYGLQGFVRESYDQLIVTILIPQGYNFLDILEFAISRVNDRHLVTKDGRGIYVSAEKVKA